MGVLDKLFDKHNISNSLARDITKPVQQLGTKTKFNRAFYRPNMVHQIHFWEKWSKRIFFTPPCGQVE